MDVLSSDDDESCESLHLSDNLSDSPPASAICVEHVSEEEDCDSDRSSLTNFSSRCKKRVMFPSDDLLVFIREIPPRGFYSESDTDTAVESDDESDEKSEDDSDSDQENEDETDSIVSEKVFKKDDVKPTIAKGNYEVSKSTGKAMAKVANITGAKLNSESKDSKKTKKKVLKRSNRKTTASPEPNKMAEKTKLPKGKQIRAKLTKKPNEKPDTKVRVPNATLTPKPRSEKVRCKSAPPNLENRTVTSKKNNGFYGISNMCNDFINDTNGAGYELSADEKLWKLFDCSGTTDRDIAARRKIENDFNFNRIEIEPQKQVNKKPDNHRPDVTSMSKMDRRHYSWLMANGNIPNPQNESPSIAPLWESSLVGESNVVKAPT